MAAGEDDKNAAEDTAATGGDTSAVAKEAMVVHARHNYENKVGEEVEKQAAAVEDEPGIPSASIREEDGSCRGGRHNDRRNYRDCCDC
ncbi:hypothetical protein MTO96_037403 [Rhipicephalus appendiculatus]